MFTTFLLLFSNIAQAYVDPACAEVADTDGDGTPGPAPSGYSEDAQQNYLLNFFSAGTTFSPLHAPVPSPAGTGSFGVELSIIPPLGCEKRLVLDYRKTEDTNKMPVLPRPRVSFAFPAIDTENHKIIPYAGLGYVPPVKVKGMQNVVMSVEAGVGIKDKEEKGLQYGLRGHATLLKTVAEIATPFEEGGEAYPDFYVGSTMGANVMLGYSNEGITPYIALGFLDVSTFFYIDDDGLVINNGNPYSGPEAAIGTQWRPNKKIQVAGEFYTVPSVIYTGRFRVSYLFN